MHESRKCRKYRLEKLQICTGWFIMIVGWEALHMKKNYDDEQKNTTAYRVRLLRQDRGWSQKELADKIFVAHSQISRLESGETTNIGSALLVSLAKVFHVSTDYLLCLTPISVPKSYDISQLGLSEEVIRRLILIRFLCRSFYAKVLPFMIFSIPTGLLSGRTATGPDRFCLIYTGLLRGKPSFCWSAASRPKQLSMPPMPFWR